MDDLNDADLFPLLSDHDPAHTDDARRDQLNRDGQRWAADQPKDARELLIQETVCPVCHGRGVSTPASYTFACPCPICHGTGRKDVPDPDRRAWLDGVRYGLDHGYRGLRPTMELDDPVDAAMSELFPDGCIVAPDRSAAA